MTDQIIVAQYCDPDVISPSLLGMWWAKFEQWAEALGVRPKEIAARFKDKPKGMVSSNGYDLSRYRRRVQEQIEGGNVEYAALTRLSDDWKYKVTDWEFYSDCGRFDNSFAMLLSGICLETLHSGPGFTSAQFTKDAISRSAGIVHASYGMAVVMPRLFMAPGYAMGIASGEMPKEMVYDVNSWSRFAGRKCNHVIRNVFGYNILNPRHLYIDVGGQRLEDWINASSQRGRLEPQENGLFVWTFQEGEDEEAFLHWDYPPVMAVREQLKEHKVFPWQQLSGVN